MLVGITVVHCKYVHLHINTTPSCVWIDIYLFHWKCSSQDFLTSLVEANKCSVLVITPSFSLPVKLYNLPSKFIDVDIYS